MELLRGASGAGAAAAGKPSRRRAPANSARERCRAARTVPLRSWKGFLCPGRTGLFSGGALLGSLRTHSEALGSQKRPPAGCRVGVSVGELDHVLAVLETRKAFLFKTDEAAAGRGTLQFLGNLSLGGVAPNGPHLGRGR